MNLTDLYEVKTKNTTKFDINYFYDYEIDNSITDDKNDVNYEDSMIILSSSSISNNNSNYTDTDYEMKNLPTSIIYILFIIVIYILILFLIFMYALYAHRRRVGYNYEDLDEEDNSETEINDSLIIKNETDINLNENDGIEKNNREYKCKNEENFSLCYKNKIEKHENGVINKQPGKENVNLNSRSNDIKFFNQLSNDCEIDMLLNAELLSKSIHEVQDRTDSCDENDAIIFDHDIRRREIMKFKKHNKSFNQQKKIYKKKDYNHDFNLKFEPLLKSYENNPKKFDDDDL